MQRRRPEPKYSFTIPSVHDDTKLECRIYHPWSFDGVGGGGSGEEAAGHDGSEGGGISSGDSAAEGAGELGIEIGERNAHAHASSDPPGGSLPARWRKKGIVVAHPYAPLGGSYDDRVVGMVVEEFVRLGWVVGTFCFRGAHDSHGRTSWTGKPEVRDYVSFAGCFMLYLSLLDPSSLSPMQAPLAHTPSSSTGSEFPTTTTTDEDSTVILAGYSHGSLILQHLPPVPSILQQFSAPVEGSAASEITLRASRLAAETNAEWKASALTRAKEQEEQRDRNARAKHRTHTRNNLSVTMGGEETAAELRRSSREIRRSMEGRRSLELGRLSFGRLGGLHAPARKSTEEDVRGGEDAKGEGQGEREGKMVAIDKQSSPSSSSPSKNPPPILIPSHIAYLLISPITPPLSYLLTPGLHSFWRRDAASHDQLLMQHDTLLVFGDQDVFSSARRTRAWVERMREGSGRVEGLEVKGAGHFWVEDGVEATFRERIRSWGMRMGMGCV